ncbi:MAG TPA: squalene/phytoene synthase family protein [Roseiflexaceae bacterium]|nr:squalene/phytoene synthase family protein [Roseiflexaceae bacterium]
MTGYSIAHCPDQLHNFKEARSLLEELRQAAGPDAALPAPTFGAASGALSLEAAYDACEQITRIHSKSFYFSSQLLPPGKRRAVRALYAFCRTSDDLVDQAQGDAARVLATWVQLVHAARPLPGHAVLVAWHDTVQRYGIERRLIDELLAGIAMDLSVQRYPSFAALQVYCYRVASVVGLMTMQIIGHADGAHPYAVQLGVALQLTNILRDVGEDAQRGRVYLPQEDMEAHGISADDVLAGRRDAAFRALMDSQIARAHALYMAAWPGIALLSRDSRLAIGAAATVYQGILGKIVANDYDVYTRRAHIGRAEKLRILAQVWWRMRNEYRPESRV